MNTPGYLDIKNSANVAKWRWRWHLQGGSSGWSARPLQDLRNEEDLRRGRAIDLKRRQLRPSKRQVINLCRERIQRALRKVRQRV